MGADDDGGAACGGAEVAAGGCAVCGADVPLESVAAGGDAGVVDWLCCGGAAAPEFSDGVAGAVCALADAPAIANVEANKKAVRK